jgi:bifunctional non-homologous end joining protein LigD
MKRLPTISPLKLIRKAEPFDHPDWIFELKHDGFRSIAYVDPDGCRLVSRRSNRFRSFNLLSESLGNLPVIETILDGELVCLDKQGHSVFNELLFRTSRPYFYAFDLLWLNGRDLRREPLWQRKERLKDLVFESKNPSLLYADHIDQYGTDFFRMISAKNLEGVVAKHRDGPIRFIGEVDQNQESELHASGRAA